MKLASASVSSAGFEKEKRTGGFGAVLGIVAVKDAREMVVRKQGRRRWELLTLDNSDS